MTSCDPDTVTYLNLKLSSTRSPLFRRSLRTLHAQTSLLRREGSKNVRGTRQLVNYKSNFLHSRFVETREFPLRPMDSLPFVDFGIRKVPLSLSRTKQKSQSRCFHPTPAPSFSCGARHIYIPGIPTSQHPGQVRQHQHPLDQGRQVQRH
jgi:hypothetical protein